MAQVSSGLPLSSPSTRLGCLCLRVGHVSLLVSHDGVRPRKMLSSTTTVQVSYSRVVPETWLSHLLHRPLESLSTRHGTTHVLRLAFPKFSLLPSLSLPPDGLSSLPTVGAPYTLGPSEKGNSLLGEVPHTRVPIRGPLLATSSPSPSRVDTPPPFMTSYPYHPQSGLSSTLSELRDTCLRPSTQHLP